MASNWYEWQEYVNQTLDELVEWKNKREQDLTMENLRLRRLLDATLQRLGETESHLPEASKNDTKDTVKP